MLPNSSLVSYCTPTQFTVCYDYRTFAQLIVDADVPDNLAAFITSPVTLYKLQVAAGNIEMAATVGARYDPTDLVALVMPDPITGLIYNGGAALIQMNADLAAFEFYGRRFEGMPDFIKDSVEQAQAKLAALEEGTEIFPFILTQQAGLTSTYNETAQDVRNRRLPSTNMRRCFGRRDNVLPYGNES